MFRDEFVRRREWHAGEAFIDLLGASQTGTNIYFHQDWQSLGANRLSLRQSLTDEVTITWLPRILRSYWDTENG